MTRPSPRYQDLRAFLETTGTEIDPVAGKGTLLTVANYYFPIPDVSEAALLALQVHWGTLFAGTFTLEGCNFEKSLNANSISDFEASAVGNWIPMNPPASASAYVDKVGTVVWTGFSGVVTAGAVGGSIIRMGNLADRRYRFKAACTVADLVRVSAATKP